jgi:hypothetical protein
MSGVATYWCPVETENGKPHYEVESDGKQMIQHLYAFPYAVDNYANNNKSRVFKWNDGKWKFVKEVPFITPRPHDEILNYLKSVVA